MNYYYYCARARAYCLMVAAYHWAAGQLKYKL